MAAVLHDVLEDTTTTARELERQGFPRPVVAAVRAPTRRRAEDYLDVIARLARHPLACAVKVADLRDNLDPTRRVLLRPGRVLARPRDR